MKLSRSGKFRHRKLEVSKDWGWGEITAWWLQSFCLEWWKSFRKIININNATDSVLIKMAKMANVVLYIVNHSFEQLTMYYTKNHWTISFQWWIVWYVSSNMYLRGAGKTWMKFILSLKRNSLTNGDFDKNPSLEKR